MLALSLLECDIDTCGLLSGTGGCLIVADYLGQMDEEDESKQIISPMFVGGAAPPESMPTTFAPNYGAQYAFNAAENSHEGGYYKGNDV